MPQMSLVVGSLTKRVALPPAQPHDKCPLLAPHPSPFSLPQPVLVPAFHDFSLCALQQTTCAFSSVSQLSIAGISDFCVCLAYVSLRRSPIIQQTCAANLHFSSLLARSVLPGHVSPRIRLPLTCSLAGSCRTIFAHWTRAQAASTPHFVHMVPHLLSWAFRGAIKRSSVTSLVQDPSQTLTDGAPYRSPHQSVPYL